jgi:hypothetical protein
MEHQNQRWLILQRYTQPSADVKLLISETETGVAQPATTAPHCAGQKKSTTVNSLLAKEVAQVGHWEPTTFEGKRYNFTMNGIAASVVDTPWPL